MKINRALLLGMALSTAVISGCGIIRQKPTAVNGAVSMETQATVTPVAQPTAAPVMVTPLPTSTPAPRMIGTKTTQSKYIFLTNGSSQALREVYLRESTVSEWGKNMVASESTVRSSETVQMFYMESGTAGMVYDMKFVDKSGNSYAIYGIDLSDMSAAVFQVDYGYATLNYTSLSSQSDISVTNSETLAQNYGSINNSSDEQWDVIYDTSDSEGEEIDYLTAPPPTNYDPTLDYSAYEGNPNYGYYNDYGVWVSYY